jgi:predicted dehydrogenase
LLKNPAPFGSWGTQAVPPDIATFAPPAGFERNDLFVEQLRHFLDVARGRAAPLCTLQDGIRALELALAAKRCSLDKQMAEWS